MFTKEQMNWFRSYVEVQKSGRINMFSISEGCSLSGLTKAQYLFVMKNYTELSAAAKSN
jgi:hypothetical protein